MSKESSGCPVCGVRQAQSSCVVDVAGEIDLNCSNAFQQSLLALLDNKPKRLIVNLSGVGYMDSSGVASLVKVLSRARKSGIELFLVALQPRVRSIFEITRLDGVFTIRLDEAAALA
jgi:anti-sigma B factor antagonist